MHGGRKVPESGARSVVSTQNLSEGVDCVGGQLRGNNDNNVHLSCAHQRPERSHDTY